MPQHRHRCGSDAERDADQDRHAYRRGHQEHVLAGQAPEIAVEQPAVQADGGFGFYPGRHRRIRACIRRCLSAGEKVARNGCEALALEFRGRVHPYHVLGPDAVLQRLNRPPRFGKAPLDVEPVEEHRIVAGKIVEVVVQHPQAKLFDLCIRRIDVDHIHVALRQGIVGDSVIHAARGMAERVAPRQARPAIGAAKEFMRQAQPQLRMLSQIAQGADAQPLRIVGAHGERIAVVEAERHADADAEFGQPPAGFLGGHGCILLQDFALDGACVFGIDIDAPCTQCLEHDGRVAQALPVLDGRMGCSGPRHDFTKDVGFGKALRT